MAAPSPVTLFISHSAEDTPLAEAIEEALGSLLKGSETSIQIRYSSSADRGPPGGAAWRKWIDDEVVRARTALVLLTRGSITRPWLLWEAGACRGVALTRSGQNEKAFPHVTPVRYGVRDEECPDPLREGQIVDGTEPERVTELFVAILDRHGVGGADLARIGQKKLTGAVDAYLDRVRTALFKAPALVSEANIQEWLARLDRLALDERWSELLDYERWLDLAFGRDEESRGSPIDVRIHRRLGEYHLRQMNYDEATRQLGLARLCAPRDIYVLRRLGEALIKRSLAGKGGGGDEIEAVFTRIKELDPQAISRYAETAALYGKYLRRILGRPKDAVEVYRDALDYSRDSYYLADLLGQTQLEVGDVPGAKEAYHRALDILGRLNDSNTWTLATKVTASLVTDDHDGAGEALGALAKLDLAPDEVKSIEDGVRDVAQRLPGGVPDLAKLLAALIPS